MLKKVNITLCKLLVFVLPLFIILYNSYDINFNFSYDKLIYPISLLPVVVYLLYVKESFSLVTPYILTVVCIIPLFLFRSGIDSYNYVKANYTWWLCLVFLIFYIFQLRKKKFRLQLTDYFVFIFFILITMSLIVSGRYIACLRGGIYRYDGYLASVSYLVILLFASKYYRFKSWHINILIISSFILCLYGIMQFFGVDPFVEISSTVWGFSVTSTFGNENFFGSYITLVLPIFMFLFIYSGKIKYFIASGLFFSCLLISYTRSAEVAFIIYFIMILYFVFKFKLKKKNLLYIGALFVILTISLNYMSNNNIICRMLSINNDMNMVLSQDKEIDNAGSYRMFIWRRAVTLLPERPLLGYGPDNFGNPFMKKFKQDVYDKIGNVYFDKAHNEYLQIAICTGIPSALCYIVFIGLIEFKALKKARKDILIVPVFCGVTGYLVQAFFNISVVSVAPVFWAMLGILSSFAYSTRNIEDDIKNEGYVLKEC